MPNEGRVEVMHANGSWGGICLSRNWDLTEASVICRMLGYNAVVEGTTEFHRRGRPSIGDKVLSQVNCRGDETDLVFCQYYCVTGYCSQYYVEPSVVCGITRKYYLLHRILSL